MLTKDEGVTWERILPFTDIDFKGIFVKDSQTIFIIGSQPNWKSYIYKSIDGGYTWLLNYYNQNMVLNGMHFTNDSVGYAVGNLGKIAKTKNGGNTWIDFSNSSINGQLNTVWFLNADTGYVGRSATFGMYRTTNGGLTWSQNFGYIEASCYSMVFVNDSVGYAGEYNSRIYKTTNYGLTWGQQTFLSTNSAIRKISFINDTTGMAVSNNYIYRTLNGKTWSSPFYSDNILSVAISKTGTAIVGDLYGGLRKSTNMSSTFTEKNPEKGLQTYRRIKFLNNRYGWVAGDGGHVLKTNNAGATWAKLNSAPYYDYANDMVAISASQVVIATQEGKLISTVNGGINFSSQTLTSRPLNAIHFPSASVGFVVGDSGVAFKTVNGGTSYTPLSTGISVNLDEVFFPSTTTGYATSSWGHFIKTANGGGSWTQLPTSGMSYIRQVYFLDNNKGYMVNDNGKVYKTTNGGLTSTLAG